ncbi:MAG: hypothetical protein ACOC1K_04450, partial [Nanoarchaeota archaeon]
EPFLIDPEGYIWHVPYALTLNHTVEEIHENCLKAQQDEERLKFLEEKAHLRLAFEDNEASEKMFIPEKLTLEEFVEKSKNKFVFLGLHGGDGENGVLQKIFKKNNISFNGPGEKCSKICMDKYETGLKLKGLEKKGIYSAEKISVKFDDLAKMNFKEIEEFWNDIVTKTDSKSLIIKPQDDGCSSGIVRLYDAIDLEKYITLMKAGALQVPPGTFKKQEGIIEMPPAPSENLMLEKFIVTDSIRIRGNKLKYTKKTGWIEVTVAVIENNLKSGKNKIHALNPSVTVAEGDVLSVEEKFQGGTGINITPPPSEILSEKNLKKVKKSIEKVADILGIEGYSRIDAFVNVENGDIIVIEVNTLPALTPSTVLYHQGLAEKPPIEPMALLESLIGNKRY